MANFQTWILRLDLCVVIIVLIHTGTTHQIIPNVIKSKGFGSTSTKQCLWGKQLHFTAIKPSLIMFSHGK